MMEWKFTDYDRGFSDGIKELIKVVNQEYSTPKCKICGSVHVVRYGHKKGVQNWLCRACGHKFVDNNALPGMKVSSDIIGSAVSMFYEGMSLNAIRRQIQQEHNIYPSDSTVYEWIKRYTKEAVESGKAETPKVGDVWVADETVLKIEGKNTWFWDIIDTKTRFLLASHLSATRTTRDARELVERAARKAGKTPKTIVTDKLASYIDGIELAFGADTKHIAARTLTSEKGKQFIERFHGTLKQRTKIMRGLKSRETARDFLDGWLVHYNYLRPHEALADVSGNHTPAEKAGIKFEYKNWLDVVKQPAKRRVIFLETPLTSEPYHPVMRSATATLGHFAGHKVRTSQPKHRKAPRGLYVSKSGAMSRHYFRGARRVR